MNDVEYENYKDALLFRIQQTIAEVNKEYREDNIEFSILEKRLALKEVLRKMEEKIFETI